MWTRGRPARLGQCAPARSPSAGSGTVSWQRRTNGGRGRDVAEVTARLPVLPEVIGEDDAPRVRNAVEPQRVRDVCIAVAGHSGEPFTVEGAQVVPRSSARGRHSASRSTTSRQARCACRGW